MLLWLEADSTTELAVLHLESFGNPRRFARTARRIGVRVPILTVHAGRSAPDQRAAISHTAATAAPLITRQALFEQAGIIATTSFGELLDAVVSMSSQPVPAGSCCRHRVQRRRCRRSPPPTSAPTPAWPWRRPAGRPAAACARCCRRHRWTTTAAVSPQAFAEPLRITAAEQGVAALIAMVVQSASADLLPVLSAARLPVPVTAVVLDQPEAVRLLPGGEADPAVPAYASPEAAARALARAARYGTRLSRPPGKVPEFADVRAELARSIVASFLARMPGGGWLSAEEADGLLRCYGLPMVEFRRVADAAAAVEAAAALGGHVVIKVDVPGLLHKTAAGAVELDLHGADEVRAAMGRLQARFAGRMSGCWSSP